MILSRTPPDDRMRGDEAQGISRYSLEVHGDAARYPFFVSPKVENGAVFACPLAQGLDDNTDDVRSRVNCPEPQVA